MTAQATAIQGILFFSGDIEEAMATFETELREGTVCPICKRFAQKYRFKFHHSMALWLIQLYKAHRRSGNVLEYFSYKDIKLPSNQFVGDYSKLAHWGLIEEQPHDPKNKAVKASGNWRITVRGMEFVEQTRTIPSHVYLYNKKAHGFDGKQINIIAAIGKNFNYEELMRS